VIFYEAVVLPDGAAVTLHPLIVQVGEATRTAKYLGTNALGEPWYDCPAVCDMTPWVQRYLEGQLPAPIILNPDTCLPGAE